MENKVITIKCNYCDATGFDAPDSLGRHVAAVHPEKSYMAKFAWHRKVNYNRGP